jgi:hypothetical protein
LLLSLMIGLWTKPKRIRDRDSRTKFKKKGQEK